MSINFGLQQHDKHGFVVGDLHYIDTLVDMNPHLKVKVLTATPSIYCRDYVVCCSGLQQLYEILCNEIKSETLFIIDELPVGLGINACKDIEEAILKSNAQCLIFVSSVEELDKFPVNLDFTCFIEEDKETRSLNIMYFEEDVAKCITV